MKKFLILVLFLSMASRLYASLQAELGYGKAITCAQAGDWKKAQDRFSSLVVDAPERSDLLYDNGVAAYRLSEFDTAAAYFKTVAQSAAPDDLKKQAHFNLGNTHVALKKFPEAIIDYQAVLAIDPANEPARHNLEKVRQMMQEQEKKDQQNKQDKQDDKNKDSQNQQNNEQQQNKNESAGNKDKEQKSDHQKDGQEKSKPDEKSNQQDNANKNDELPDNHNSSPASKQKSKKADSQPTKNDAKEQEIQAGAIEDNENERKKEDNDQLLEQLGSDKKWMAQILNRQEKADEKAQKKLVKATVDKELAGHHGQNCW